MSNLWPDPADSVRPGRDARSIGAPGDDTAGDIANDPALAPLLRGLTAEPTERELLGLGAALTAFRAAHVTSPAPPSRRRPSMLSALTGAKLGAAIAAATVSVGGVAAAAYVSANATTTPDAHATAAPSATHPVTDPTGTPAPGTEHATATPVGPNATGHPAYGLCTAWKGVADSGKAMESVAMKNLTAAAGGADKIAAFCANVPAPGKSADHPTGKPTSTPTGKPETVPTGKPTSTPTGKPASVPTPSATHPTGRS
ncbi:hypothetical protein N865_20600 [Intrasporangium oryzae NRRL B-24470]|uniref:Uncharacterized protein n=2 Tax=Intrasporangium TaxID=53357 RepID=W9GDV2_9MICO|nr:hypothetical protein N865_20600 [Intrasporangium oryzae NRRL B-24470]